jgi:ADP-heptose:LPS heptosyltransferase
MLQAATLKYPDAAVDIISSSLSADLFAHHPQIRTLWRIDKKRYSMHWLSMWKLCVGKRYSLIVDMRGSALSYFLCTKKRWVFRGSTQPISKHAQFKLFLSDETIPLPSLWESHEDALFAERICNNKQIIAFAPIANWPPKEWPLEKFTELALALLQKNPSATAMLICAPHEFSRMKPMVDALQSHNPIILCGAEIGLTKIYACLKRAVGFVGNDSGLMHMAAAASIPTLGLFGPTDALVYQPVGKHAHAMIAPDNNLQNLSTDAVLSKFEEFTKNAPKT